jgi:peptidoglycan/xylan/chitin deacetylase (PgdA/CDA1 family)
MKLTYLHNLLGPRFPMALWGGHADRREIALTFDDGPHAVDTPQLLAVLAHYDLSATFFQIGSRVAAAPELTRMIATAGHQVGIHGYRHRSFLFERFRVLRRQLIQTQELIAHATGREAAAIRDVRPPFGHFTPATLRALVAWGYRPVMWSVVPFHWLQSADTTVRQVLRDVENGSIVVLHEGLHGPPVIDLVQATLPLLIAAGYRFITIDEMWQSLSAVGDP